MENGNQQQQDQAKKHRLQMEALLKDGEFKKNVQRKIQLDIAIRQAKHKIDLLSIDMDKAKKEIEKIDMGQIALTKEMKILKKEISEM
ncbi:MAG: hypothetical protein UY41_C0046G0007 [Candidatus Moranbacteria bacterium GW2011_GWE1_49_15]|nr:MAG: hypothetical protein UY41_C0046G0007 [Candidatus Moranbacteria bacterium GW2011_GWE1_49_15]